MCVGSTVPRSTRRGRIAGAQQMYRVQLWGRLVRHRKRRTVTVVEWLPLTLYPHVGSIAIKLGRPTGVVAAFKTQCGFAKQIKEGTSKMWLRRPSCRKSCYNEVRVPYRALACILRNFMRMLALPKAVEWWSLNMLLEKLVESDTKAMRHGCYMTFQLAEVAIPLDLFLAGILRCVDRLRPRLAPA